MSATIPQDIEDRLTKFRLRRATTAAAVVLKIDVATLSVQHDETFEDAATLLADLQDALPESAPRYVVLSWVLPHRDGRVSYPLVLVYYTPETARKDLNMVYAATRPELARVLGSGTGKVLELRDAEDLTDAWVLSELGH